MVLGVLEIEGTRAGLLGGRGVLDTWIMDGGLFVWMLLCSRGCWLVLRNEVVVACRYRNVSPTGLLLEGSEIEEVAAD